MDESTLEKKVGDILTRKRIIASLLHDSCEETAYGPLTLQTVNDGDAILATDFDGRVYPTIELLDTDDSEEQINHLVTEADNCIEQLHEEL